MEKKKALTQTALAALVLASALPIDGQAGQVSGTQETFLAVAGCGANKCGSSPRRGEVADNATGNESYNTRSSTYQSSSNYGNMGPGSGYTGTSSGMGTGGSGYSGTSGYGGSTSGNFGKTSGSYSNTDASRMNRDIDSSRNTNETYNTYRTYNDSYGSYDSNRPYNANPGKENYPSYRESYRNSSYDVNVGTPYGADVRVNRGYNTSGEYDYNRTNVGDVPASETLTEADLLGMLSPQGRAIYMSLDAEGKALALQLASQETYRDKNLAVKEAQRRVNERRGLMNR
ncbi:hypothetical protein [Candidatus Protochlamydia phocaeensis]|uniref:hypothetical protein n=1 Tax=Candidatus Protochlamydia phocaeensis TaxID=1414722 RepID=UPI0008382B2F|nr:hypothetical protein [Candidatus Protochlamydia phocaeensis]